MTPKEVAQHIAETFDYDQVIGLRELDELLETTLPEVGSLVFIQCKQMERMTALDQLARELLREHSLMLQNVRGVGYKVVTPAKQTRAAVQESQHKIGKELLKAKRRVTCVRTDELTHEQQREREDALAKLAGIGKMLK